MVSGALDNSGRLLPSVANQEDDPRLYPNARPHHFSTVFFSNIYLRNLLSPFRLPHFKAVDQHSPKLLKVIDAKRERQVQRQWLVTQT
jgi:hypothetical protein